jgi:hypothetical protein
VTRRKLIVVSFFLVCLALIIGGFLYWHSEQLAEEKLKEYIERLKDSGFTVEERSLADFNIDSRFEWHFFGDFRSYATQEGVDVIYLDREIRALYFLHSIPEAKIQAEIFYYKG